MLRRINEFMPDIKDYYTIDDEGNVYSDNINGAALKKRKTQGYLKVVLSHLDGTQQSFSIHRLVMMAFNPVKNQDELQVNHIDADKTNNSLSNLEWCTASENQKHAVRLGIAITSRQWGENNPQCKLTDKEVAEIFKLRSEGLTHQKIADMFGVSRRHIGNILQGKRRNKNQVQSSTTIPLGESQQE